MKYIQHRIMNLKNNGNQFGMQAYPQLAIKDNGNV
jgi:hypothetical protein